MTDIAILIAGVVYETTDPSDVEHSMELLMGVSEAIRGAKLPVSIAVHTAAATSPESLAEMLQRYLDAASFKYIIIFGSNGVEDFAAGGLSVKPLLTERGSEDHLVLFLNDAFPVKVSFLPRITRRSRGLAAKAAVAKIKDLTQTLR